jgi:hyperosmotically inducible periplasmic protein
MKTILIIELTAAVLIAGASFNAWSQTGDAARAPVNAQGSSAMAASGSAAPTPGRKADRALRRKVYAAIGKHKEISAGDISIVARDGAVTLNGTVTDASQIGQVADIARGVDGVVSVTSKLTVKKPFGGM